LTDVVKNLAQSNPAATTSTDLYTVPDSTVATITSLSICNQNAGAGTFRVSVGVAGAVLAKKQYLYYDHAIAANDTVHIVIGLTLGPADVLRVYASNADMSFNLSGVETR